MTADAATSYMAVRYPYRLQLIVPSQDHRGVPIDEQRRRPVIDKLAEELCRWAGGLTVTERQGQWVSASGQVQSEPVTTLDSFGRQPVDDVWLQGLVQLIEYQLDQDCVAVILNGTMLFYDREDSGEADVL